MLIIYYLPIMLQAINTYNLDYAITLCQSCINPDLEQDANHATPLVNACYSLRSRHNDINLEQKWTNLIELLLQKGSNPNHYGGNLGTPLTALIYNSATYLTENFAVEILKLLLKFGANVNDRPYILAHAVGGTNPKPEVVKLLLQYGICQTNKNGTKPGYTPLESVKISRKTSPQKTNLISIQFMLEHGWEAYDSQQNNLRVQEQLRIETEQKRQERLRVEAEQERHEQLRIEAEHLRIETKQKRQEQLRVEAEQERQEQLRIEAEHLRIETEQKRQEQLRVEAEQERQEQLRIEAEHLRIETKQKRQEQLRVEAEQERQEQLRIEEEKKLEHIRIEEEQERQDQLHIEQERQEQLRIEEEKRLEQLRVGEEKLRQTKEQKANLQILLEKERIEKYNLATYLNKLLQEMHVLSNTVIQLQTRCDDYEHNK